MVYLKVQAELSAEEEERMLIQSMVSMEEFACGLRLRLRKMLVVRCKLVRAVKGRRKKRVWERRDGGEREGGEVGGEGGQEGGAVASAALREGKADEEGEEMEEEP